MACLVRGDRSRLQRRDRGRFARLFRLSVADHLVSLKKELKEFFPKGKTFVNGFEVEEWRLNTHDLKCGGSIVPMNKGSGGWPWCLEDELEKTTKNHGLLGRFLSGLSAAVLSSNHRTIPRPK